MIHCAKPIKYSIHFLKANGTWIATVRFKTQVVESVYNIQKRQTLQYFFKFPSIYIFKETLISKYPSIFMYHDFYVKKAPDYPFLTATSPAGAVHRIGIQD